LETRPKQTLTLTPRLRQELKSPLGTLFKRTPKETMKELNKLLLREKPSCLISVGDIVSKNMLKHGIQPQVIIVDNQVMRKRSTPINAGIRKKIDVKNPAGTLTPESWKAIERALKQIQPSQVMVEGEEDLLTLVAVLTAPDNSLVVYGQPHEGLVAVKVDKTTKERVAKIVDNMEPIPKS
jgi:uncharacterized protein (UPF0218 family)